MRSYLCSALVPTKRTSHALQATRATLATFVQVYTPILVRQTQQALTKKMIELEHVFRMFLASCSKRLRFQMITTAWRMIEESICMHHDTTF